MTPTEIFGLFCWVVGCVVLINGIDKWFDGLIINAICEFLDERSAALRQLTGKPKRKHNNDIPLYLQDGLMKLAGYINLYSVSEQEAQDALITIGRTGYNPADQQQRVDD